MTETPVRPAALDWSALLGAAVVGTRDGAPVLGSLIAGRGVTAQQELEPRISPATGGVLFHGGNATDADVDDAVAAARRAFDEGSWGRATGRDRSKVLLRAAALLEERSESFAQLLVLEAGKPIREARGEVGATINAFEYFAGLARDINGRTVRDISTDVLALTLREPAGVAGLIIPWNFPLAILGQKLPPALAAGCAIVAKPSELTPLSTIAASVLLHEAGLPAEALNVVVAGGAAGAALVQHPGTDVISFTGSTTTGRRIAANAGTVRLKRVAMEAGGKTPVVVTANADLDQAVEGLLFASFFNQGQVCVAGSRILAHRSVADELSARLAARAGQIRLGDPYDLATEMGPLVSANHHAGVLAGVGTAVEQGARIVTGGRTAQVDATAAAPFLTPTVLWSEQDENHGVREELFGPVTVVQPFDTLDEVVRRSNDSSFGLAASVWTKDLDEALNLTLALRTGTVWVNGSTDAFPEIPLGGRRDSGYNPEFGREGMEFFTDLKTVQLRRSASPAWYAR